MAINIISGGTGLLNYGYGSSGINSTQLKSLLSIDTTSAAATVNSVADIDINNLKSLFGVSTNNSDLSSVENTTLFGLSSTNLAQNLILGNTGYSGSDIESLYNAMKANKDSVDNFGYDQYGRLIYKNTVGSFVNILT